MATNEEIELRVKQSDTARSAKRSITAVRVGELAQRRAAVAEQLADIERELGDVLAGASDVIDIDELARFTDVPAADLARWLTNRKSARGRRKRPTVARTDSKPDDNKELIAEEEPKRRHAPSLQERAVARTDSSETSARVVATVP
ncbi:hypothetical protein LWC34_45090 [Kibdelosporangium philippinense]|uniref:Uncharacterized protein n=1 Tax=Kibdelosporangium philippinense TaxID=211113 RepID=A0ABS8ZQE3_9PSEU|nr:hypothetical protein [Kibdelosporangium philippinense]MCE7009935.1 hypothetical protein [Kibdelosporangium philippinense]